MGSAAMPEPTPYIPSPQETRVGLFRKRFEYYGQPVSRFHGDVHDRQVAIPGGQLEGKGTEELGQNDLRLRHGKVLRKRKISMLASFARVVLVRAWDFRSSSKCYVIANLLQQAEGIKTIVRVVPYTALERS